jgi:hypothetical protein
MQKSILIFNMLMVFGYASAIAQNTKKANNEPTSHKVVVMDVLQTTSYTYLQVKEGDAVKWLAVPSTKAEKGETYYYTGELPMKDFESKELHRKFDEVLFLGGVSPSPITANTGKPHPTGHGEGAEPYKRKATVDAKKSISVDVPSGCVTIAELMGNKDTYQGKTVKIKGQVTKYSPDIMDKNWIHIQDGTEANGKYDFTITSKSAVKVGDVAVFEGKIATNKDFGYGYTFEVMMEEATLK